MEISLLYHGSNVEVVNPKILINGHYKDFADGRIEREVFWAYAKFKYPTHQIVFCTEEALNCITFEGSENIEK